MYNNIKKCYKYKNLTPKKKKQYQKIIISPLRELNLNSPLPKVVKVREPNINTNINILNIFNDNIDNNLLSVINELITFVKIKDMPEKVKEIINHILLVIKDPIKRNDYGLNNLDIETIKNKLAIITWNLLNQITNNKLDCITDLSNQLKIASQKNNVLQNINYVNINYVNIIINESINVIRNINWNDPYIIYDY
jgi:hypothetical protein